jgi:hypothetical protein
MKLIIAFVGVMAVSLLGCSDDPKTKAVAEVLRYKDSSKKSEYTAMCKDLTAAASEEEARELGANMAVEMFKDGKKPMFWPTEVTAEVWEKKTEEEKQKIKEEMGKNVAIVYRKCKHLVEA